MSNEELLALPLKTFSIDNYLSFDKDKKIQCGALRNELYGLEKEKAKFIFTKPATYPHFAPLVCCAGWR